jgi:hypothetical protein
MQEGFFLSFSSPIWNGNWTARANLKSIKSTTPANHRVTSEWTKRGASSLLHQLHFHVSIYIYI